VHRRSAERGELGQVGFSRPLQQPPGAVKAGDPGQLLRADAVLGPEALMEVTPAPADGGDDVEHAPGAAAGDDEPPRVLELGPRRTHAASARQKEAPDEREAIEPGRPADVAADHRGQRRAGELDLVLDLGQRVHELIVRPGHRPRAARTNGIVHALLPEHLVECPSELGVAIVQQEPRPQLCSGNPPRQLPCLLGHPARSTASQPSNGVSTAHRSVASKLGSLTTSGR